jgi:hypothetical protein
VLREWGEEEMNDHGRVRDQCSRELAFYSLRWDVPAQEQWLWVS